MVKLVSLYVISLKVSEPIKNLKWDLCYKDNKIQDVLGSDLKGEENFIR